MRGLCASRTIRPQTLKDIVAVSDESFVFSYMNTLAPMSMPEPATSRRPPSSRPSFFLRMSNSSALRTSYRNSGGSPTATSAAR